MKPVTLVTAYYENKGMLAEQARIISSWPQELRRHWKWIIVDDGSPNNPAVAPVIPDVEVQLYRCKVDIPWNQDFCRNLGAHVATTSWMLLTDMDHAIPEATARSLICDTHRPEIAYKLSRVSAPDMTPYKPHPNSWFMTRGIYASAGGYDERFAGHYGSDGEFADRVKLVAPISMLLAPLIRYPRAVIPDASTTRYIRKLPEDKAAVHRIKGEVRAKKLKPLNLQAPWERVS